MEKTLTVYIVDDDPSVRDALGLLLSVRGYRTAVFASGEDFLSAWQRDWSGCLLIDIRMPGMDGLTLQRKLGELNCHLPVIIITGHGDASLARQAFKARASDFL
ncbi:MAG: response regulator, partial [Sterolibacterium sp.]